MAHRFFSDRDVKTFDKFNKELIDDTSAAIILQEFLDRK